MVGEEDLTPSALVKAIGSSDEGVRKRAVFRLQSLIGDPSFTDQFIGDGGLEKLQLLAKNANGNTLAYTLASFSIILELDQGWEFVDRELITRVGRSGSDWIAPADLHSDSYYSSLLRNLWSTFYEGPCRS